ncbi:MAG TPA: flippase activity-associated protein Agl23 [Ktedonosporobacter sp.]|jgi:predicted membrane-bound mannosyltransferase|nr:flippase activity-associated protein Agl23 [Ktedonosporobacter sp.]
MQNIDDEMVKEETVIEDEEDGELVAEPEVYRRRRFALPTRGQLIAWSPYLAVVLLGAILRFWGLGDKPLHHDESLHAYFSLQLMLNPANYRYDPLLHGPFQFHAIALVYKISQLLGAYDNGVNTTTVRIAAATLGTVIVGLPYFLRDYLGKIGAWLACLLLAVSPSMVYFSRFAREDIYMACFTLLLVVSVARYVRSRRMGWLIMAGVAFALSYATKEATFLSIAVFGSFFGALFVWELGLKWRLPAGKLLDATNRVPTGQGQAQPLQKYLPRTGAPIVLLLYFLIMGALAKVFFDWLKNLSIYITTPANVNASDAYVANLKAVTLTIVIPLIGFILCGYVLSILIREMRGKLPPPGRHGFARKIDPEKQPLLDTIFTMPWMHWFFALLSGWAIFLLLFSVLFTNIPGIADGIWQGLYYWIQQQQVARGGQPWYYYFLLIPLYEQIGLVFGLVGIVRCLLRPTRFRLFLVYWFVGNVFIYSWAAEKMPWLMIHMTMPMMLLAAIGLEPVVVTLRQFAKERLGRFNSTQAARAAQGWAPQPSRVGVRTVSIAIMTLVLAILLLLPTLENMYQVSYVHAADGPHEMMVYVQTTTDVNIVMAKVDALDQRLYGGKHLLPIGVMDDASWPFYWYLRDYTNVCYNFPSGCTANVQAIIVGGDHLDAAQAQYATANGNKPADFLFHQYHMRTWWDEGYKPPPCIETATHKCDDALAGGGVGPLLWLSYGDTPPPGATFNLGLAAQNVWQWWWQRKAIGSTTGSYDMGLFIRKDLGVSP